jgi:hypothetical protein
LETEEEVDEKKLKGRAAEFFFETDTLFVNGSAALWPRGRS